MKLLSLAPLAVLLLQAGVNPLQQQKPSGSIEGIVTRSGSNQPIPNARVTVTRRTAPPAAPGGAVPTAGRGAVPALPPILPVMTDDNGKYVVAGLEDGTFNVNVLA